MSTITEDPSLLTREELENRYVSALRRIDDLQRSREILEDTSAGRWEVIQSQKRDLDRLGADLRHERIARQAAEEQVKQMERGLD